MWNIIYVLFALNIEPYFARKYMDKINAQRKQVNLSKSVDR